jgi:hypothetical protein
MTQTADTFDRSNEKGWHRKLRERVEGAVAGTLEPGEQIQTVVQAQVWPRFFLGLEALFGPLMFLLVKYYTVALTDRRVILLPGSKATGRPTGVEWAAQREAVTVETYRPGLLVTKLFLTRPGTDEILRLRIARRFSDTAERIAGALGAKTG